MNEQIRLSPIRLIDQEKQMLGVVPTAEALRMARDAGLDLVEVSPTERPPVCRIMDYGKHKYLLSKKQKHKHHEQKLKELRLRPKTDPHDMEIKLKRAREFLGHGDKVQFTMMFRGRERFHQDIGREIFNEITSGLTDIAKVEKPAFLLGRRMTMILVSTKLVTPKPKSDHPPGPAKPSLAPVKAPGAAPGVPQSESATAANIEQMQQGRSVGTSQSVTATVANVEPRDPVVATPSGPP